MPDHALKRSPMLAVNQFICYDNRPNCQNNYTCQPRTKQGQKPPYCSTSSTPSQSTFVIPTQHFLLPSIKVDYIPSIFRHREHRHSFLRRGSSHSYVYWEDCIDRRCLTGGSNLHRFQHRVEWWRRSRQLELYRRNGMYMIVSRQFAKVSGSDKWWMRGSWLDDIFESYCQYISGRGLYHSCCLFPTHSVGPCLQAISWPFEEFWYLALVQVER